MRGSDIFDLYRQLLAIVVSTYIVVRMVNFVLRWQLATEAAPRWEALVRRYLTVQLMRLRVRRFLFELGQVAVLAAVFGYLLLLHWRR